MLTSIFPKIPFLAMTATATFQMKKDIAATLGLIDPIHIEASPDRPNIVFSAMPRPNRGDDKLQPILFPLVEELKAKRSDFPLTIVYGNLRVIGECFSSVSEMMGLMQYEPVGSSQCAANRLFTQFHANYPEHEQERIVQDLVSGTSKLRLLFVTVAFGIGVDVNNIRRVIHIGVPHTIEEYFQEAGRGGRDGLPACSTIYYNSYDLAPTKNLSVHMIDFIRADKCKREIILNYFGYKSPERTSPEHTCCDYHQNKCCCDDCILTSAAQMMELATSDECSNTANSVSMDVERCVPLTSEQKDLLKGHLLNYRQFLHGYGKSCVGSVGLCTGFSLELIDAVLDNASELTSLDEVTSKLPLFDDNRACVIFEILESVRKQN
jgi:superfamily II DNA helicase RecQ